MIAKKHAQSYMPNGELSLEQVIQAAIDEAGNSPDPVKLAELGWQMIECPICGGCAQAFPKPDKATQSATVPVVGEVVAWRWFDSMDELVISELDPLELGINASVLEPLIVRPTTSITAAELDALRKDAERLDAAMKIMFDDWHPLSVAFAKMQTASTRDELFEQLDAAIAGEKK